MNKKRLSTAKRLLQATSWPTRLNGEAGIGYTSGHLHIEKVVPRSPSL
jgi:hypothetical protein